MKKKTELTLTEKCLIDHLHLFPHEITWTDIYKGSHNTSKVKMESLPQTVSKWKNSKLVQDYVKQSETKVKNYLNEKTKENTVLDENGKRVFLGKDEINFTNLNEFINFLNTKANNLTDEKERQKYLQMLSDLLRFKDQDTKDSDIIRFYMPVKCCNCPLKSK